MQGEDLEAGNNLRSLSQRTSYISDWTDKKAALRAHHNPILEQPEEPQRPPPPKRAIQKETSEKYDLRKYEKKLQSINDSPFPIQKTSEIKPNKVNQVEVIKQASTPSIFKRKKTLSLPLIRSLEGEFLRRQVQLFHRKNTESQKNLQGHLASRKQKYLPLSLNAKREQKQAKQPRVMVGDEQIEQIKRIISNGSRRNSLPFLMQEEQHFVLPAIRAIH